MADNDWRVTVTLREQAQTRQALESVGAQQVEDEVRHRLGDRVVVSDDGPRVFVYADSGDAARQADRIVRDVLAQRGLPASFALDRWHPVAEDWEDASVPLPVTESMRRAEHDQSVAEDTWQSRTTGQPVWQVHATLGSRREAVALAARMADAGRQVLRRWRYLMIGADNEDDANVLVREIAGEADARAVFAASDPFVHFPGTPPAAP